MRQLFNNTFDGKRVLVTGHTGFKGSWLTVWLQALGADVIGFSQPEPPSNPSMFELAELGRNIIDIRGDVGDVEALKTAVQTHQPDIVLHLAAQPIVLRSFEQPQETFMTNTMGTVNVLEAVRSSDSVKAVVCVTTDKVYENKEWFWGYRESDQLGGYDPYSASKAMAELGTAAYRQSFFSGGRGPAVATARAGNVIGGGDFAQYRLVPDCMRALMAGDAIAIRNPLSVRPWQHVLESLSGYLWLAAKLVECGDEFAEAWNFGPMEQVGITAGQLAQRLVELWGEGSWIKTNPELEKAETGLLRLSWAKASSRMGWQPVYSWEESLADIVDWFKAYQSGDTNLEQLAKSHIQRYVDHAARLNPAWVS